MDAKESPGPRPWTEAELHKLYRDYFDKQPGICPVCGSQVSMMMDHKEQLAILSIRCRVCGNASTVFA